MKNIIDIQDVISFLTSSDIKIVKQISEACHARIRHESDIKNIIGIAQFSIGQRVKLVGNIQKKYQGRLGTIIKIKQKRISVNLDRIIDFDEVAGIINCFPEHLEVLSPEDENKNQKSTNINIVKLNELPKRNFYPGERVRIKNEGRSKWSGIEGTVKKVGPKNLVVHTEIGGVRVSPSLVEKITK